MTNAKLPSLFDCANCGSSEIIRDTSNGYHTIHCDDCYDGAPDGHNELITSTSAECASDDWNEIQADREVEKAEKARNSRRRVYLPHGMKDRS